ncbi:MAG: FxsA family protein [Alphaproteobacteria bacterium]|nr:FxsA family protein [Alphaproteobacteria bacterium]
MALWILLAFIGVPLIEIALFIQVGGLIGLWPTIAIVIATAMAGTALIRRQGLNTLQRAQQEMDAQRLPVRELFDGICLIFAGAMLLTPGFLTDAVGFTLLVPPLRALLGRYIWRALQNAKGVQFEMAGGRPYRDDDGPIVDADAVEIKGELDEKPHEPH